MTSLQPSHPISRTVAVASSEKSVIHTYPILEAQLLLFLQTRDPSKWEEYYKPPMKEARVLPPQIKNKNMVYPILERSSEEYFDHVDQRLDWLSSSVEEEDDEAKNNETFGVN